jgi:hypothetical protein
MVQPKTRLFCLDEAMETELQDGCITLLTKGMCYFIGDSNEVHRSLTTTGCKILIVD